MSDPNRKPNPETPPTPTEECIISPVFALRYPGWNYYQSKEEPVATEDLEVLPSGDVYFFNWQGEDLVEPAEKQHLQLRITARAIPALLSMLQEAYDWLKTMPEDGPDYLAWKRRWDKRHRTKPLPTGISRVTDDDDL
jgi:hypothetical protein